jgi:hypothetical protein
MTAPAVTEVCLPQPAHSKVKRLPLSGQPLRPPQAGQTKPSGQRRAKRCAAQAASSGNRASNAARDIGRSCFPWLAIHERYTNHNI